MTEVKQLRNEVMQLKRKVGILSGTLHLMNTEIGKYIRKKYKDGYISKVHKRNKSYPFIPYTPSIAIEQLMIAFNHLKNIPGTKRFLDAGCGIGNIMLLARTMGFDVCGLEIDPTVIKVAKQINRDIASDIKKQNITTYKKYSNFDVIYYFCPIDQREKQQKFEEYVENQMKVGAILIPNYKASGKIRKDKRFNIIEPEDSNCFVYKKVSEI